MRAALDVFEGRLIGGDHSGAGAGFDRHVADRHPGFHRQLADGRTAVFEDVALSPAGADLRNDGEDDVLRARAFGQVAVDGDRHRLEGLEAQCLRGEHMFDLGGADAEGERSEGSVSGSVRVAADDGGARLSQAQLRSHDVDDALVGVAEAVQADAEFLSVLAQGVDLRGRGGFGDRLVDVPGRGVVVLGGDGEVGAAHGAPGESESVEGLRAGHLVDEVQVDVDKVRRTVFTL